MIYKLYTRYSKHLHMVSMSYHPGILFCKVNKMSVEVNGDFEQMIIKAKLWNMRQTLHVSILYLYCYIYLIFLA